MASARITVIDHALTRPWTVDKKYVHSPDPRPRWNEASCTESMNSSLIAIGRESYFMSADGILMPVRKNQSPPDLRYFKQLQK
jgi:alpha-D-ribose 1-methylphosphonate 5-phosphate C-P lyase